MLSRPGRWTVRVAGLLAALLLVARLAMDSSGRGEEWPWTQGVYSLRSSQPLSFALDCRSAKFCELMHGAGRGEIHVCDWLKNTHNLRYQTGLT